MRISVYGAGYVGLVSAACLAHLGHSVVCADIDETRIAKLLQGECPIYEEQLPELIRAEYAHKRLNFTANLEDAINQAEIHIIATGTPSLEDGSADLSQVFSVATKISQIATKDTIVVTKSTVPVGTGKKIEEHLDKILRSLGKKVRLHVASNPEFLREGTAVLDFLQADRVIIGGDETALSALELLYEPLTKQGIPLVKMSLPSAELTKYAANSMLALRISFMNQISQIAAKTYADIEEIRQGMALDNRIGPHFLQAGIGYGGSCFPKDVRALVHTANHLEVESTLLQSIDRVNELQKNWIHEQLLKHFQAPLSNLRIGIWGLSFKPGTDDLREASSLVAIDHLSKTGAKLRLYDPVSMEGAKQLVGDNPAITWCNSAEAVLQGNLDALVIATEWPEFKQFSLKVLKEQLCNAPIFDGRNCFRIEDMRAAQLSYYSVGRPAHMCQLESELE